MDPNNRTRGSEKLLFWISYLKALARNWWAIFAGIILALDQTLAVVSPSLSKWLDDHVNAGTRLEAEWLSIFICVVLAGALAYREQFNHTQELLRQLNGERQRTGPNRNTKHDAIRILVGTEPPFSKLVTFPVGTKRRTASVGLQNLGNGYLSNCAVFISGIWTVGSETKQTRALLEKGFSLLPNEIRYVEVAAYDELYPDGVSSGNHIIIPLPQFGGFYHGARIVVDKDPQKSEVHRVVIEASCTDASLCELECSLWIDFRSKPHLRFEAA